MALAAIRQMLELRAAKLRQPVLEMLREEWYLGFTLFGGPAVHFQVFRKKFVDELQWIDEQTEMFALCQALPGPGSTKFLYAINLIRSGFTVAILSFFVWSLPGAFAAYGLAVGISNISDTLPDPVYALLSGLNSATVGIIALAAVQLSSKAITDRLTRILVFMGGAAGMLYNALWYFPVLMVVGGLAAVLWDYRIPQDGIVWLKRRLMGRNDNATNVEEQQAPVQIEMADDAAAHNVAKDNPADTVNRRIAAATTLPMPAITTTTTTPTANGMPTELTSPSRHTFSLRIGIGVMLVFLASFIIIMVLRGTLNAPPQPFSLFANLYLAGTIIFGGGPVVIPLLRSYVVAAGWVSPRDFLLGLALIQAFPGPNFNFAVYLGALGVRSAIPKTNMLVGALIGFIAIFTPGLAVHTGTMQAWRLLRRHRWVASVLRGINATAVGLIYAAVYRLWDIGAVGRDFRNGASLAGDPWWLVTAATAYVGGMWFALSAPLTIILGGVMGLVWYGVVRR